MRHAARTLHHRPASRGRWSGGAAAGLHWSSPGCPAARAAPARRSRPADRGSSGPARPIITRRRAAASGPGDGSCPRQSPVRAWQSSDTACCRNIPSSQPSPSQCRHPPMKLRYKTDRTASSLFMNAPVDRKTTSPDRLARPASPFVLQARRCYSCGPHHRPSIRPAGTDHRAGDGERL